MIFHYVLMMFQCLIILLICQYTTKVDLTNKRGLHMVTDYLAEAGTTHAKGRLRSSISLQEVGPEN